MLLDDVAVLEVFLNTNLVSWIVMRFRTIMFPRRTILLTFVIPSFFISGNHDIYIFGFQWNISTIVGKIAIEFDTHCHVALRMDCFKFEDLLTCPQAPSSVVLISEKIMTFPSGPALLAAN